MDLDLTVLNITALLVAGLIGGFINTLAGGGSMLTLPALMMLGLPADIANATNRVGVLFQSLTAVKGFRKYDRLDSSAIVPMLAPTMIGAVAGSLLASYLPVWVLKPTLLASMITMALVMLVRPDVLAPAEGTANFDLREKPGAMAGLFFAGV